VLLALFAATEWVLPAIAVEDREPTPTSVSFSDSDLDAGDVGGIVSWQAAANATEDADHFRVYLALDAVGAGRSEVGRTANSMESFFVPEDTSIGAFTHIVVYAASNSSEYTTPASAVLTDSSESVSAPAFTDLDLDAGEIGGQVSWAEPGNSSGLVSSYRLYLAQSARSLELH
ncbi:unnamed protein product, partial [Polarella glacialis]